MQQTDDSKPYQTSSLTPYYDKNEQWIKLILILTIFAFFITFKTIILNCPCCIFINDNAIKDAVYILFREVVIVLACILILEGLYYYEILSYSYFMDN